MDASAIKQLSSDAQYALALSATRTMIAGLVGEGADAGSIHGGILAAVADATANIVGAEAAAQWLRGAAARIERDASRRVVN